MILQKLRIFTKAPSKMQIMDTIWWEERAGQHGNPFHWYQPAQVLLRGHAGWSEWRDLPDSKWIAKVQRSVGLNQNCWVECRSRIDASKMRRCAVLAWGPSAWWDENATLQRPCRWIPARFLIVNPQSMSMLQGWGIRGVLSVAEKSSPLGMPGQSFDSLVYL